MKNINMLLSAVISVSLVACGEGVDGTGVSRSELVSFDLATGTGFVGKGDVQQAFGWNNAVLQANAGDLAFSVVAEDTFSYTCEWFTGPEHNRTQHEVTRTRSSSVNATVSYEARARNQVTGFILTGFGTVVETGGDVPAVGDACPGNPGTGAVVTEVESLGSTAGGLYVTHNGVSAQL